MTDIAAVILAAGASKRFGQSKQLLDWQGKPLVSHVADVALDAGLDPVIVVLGHRPEETYYALGERPVQKLINWHWEEGMSTSVRTGLAAVPPHAQGALFMQCDQPLVGADLLLALVDTFQRSEGKIVHPVHDGRRGTPVLFPRRFFPELAAVTGDQGGRDVIGRHAAETTTLTVDDPVVLTDVDTPSDYAELQAWMAGAQRSDATAVLAAIRHVIIDMDGVLWRGDEPLPGLTDFFSFLRGQDIGFILATNNASQTPESYADKIARFGVEVPVDCVLTSSLVVAAYLADVAPFGAPVFAIGETGLVRALEEKGFVLQNEDADYVVVGWDRDLTYEKLTTASLLIHAGAEFVGTNPDVTYPTEAGPAAGNGAILAAVRAATGVKPVVTGKPQPRMYQEALRRLGADPTTTAMIGDRLDTDILGAARVGLTTVLTLSGISTREELGSSSVTPDLVCENLADLTDRWRRTVAS